MLEGHPNRFLLAVLVSVLLAGGIARAASNEPATLLSPTPGSTFPDTTVTFTWSAGVGVVEYALGVSWDPEWGPEPGPRDTSLSRTVTGLPSNGEQVTVGLWSYFADGTTGYREYTFTGMPANPLATLASPTPGSTLPDTTVTFTWTAGVGVLEYGLQVGTTLGGTNLADVSTGTTRSITLTGLPSNNRPVYVRLRSRRASGWQALDYTFTALNGSATLLSPTPGSTFPDTTVTFTWSAGVGVVEYALGVSWDPEWGPEPGPRDTSLSRTVTGLPSNGEQVTVGLWSYFADGTTGYRGYTFTGMPANPLATLASPTPGSTLPDTTVTFTWTAGVEVLEYGLQVGTTLGGTNLADVSTGTTRSITLTGLPSNNRPVYVRLRSRRASGWQALDYTFTALNGSATLLSPTPGSTFPDTTVTFTWSAGVGVVEYALGVSWDPEWGPEPGPRDTSLSRTVTGLPSNGEQVTVGLWSYFADGTTGYRGYTFTAKTTTSQDTTPPVITLVFGPPDPTRLRTLTVSVTATDNVTPADQLQFAFSLDNETTYSAYGAASSVTYVNVPDGSHTIRVKARDLAGNESVPLAVIIRVDTIPPAISVTAPTPGFLTREISVTVAGTVTETSTITALTVNGQAVSLTGTAFSYSLALTEGANTITVTAEDAAGNTATASLSGTRDTLGPLLVITSPLAGATIDQTTLAVEGTVSDATGVLSVVVNGIPATLSGGTFTVAGVPLPVEGPNLLAVAATDTLGNTTTVQVTVFRESPPSGPIILAFEPSRAPVGASLTVHGSGFGPTPADNRVTFASPTQGRVLALVESASATRLTVRVPEGARSGPVTVEVGGQTSSPFQFTVEGPGTRQITGPVATIPIGGAPAGIAIHRGLNLAVVAKPAEGAIALLDLVTRQVVGEVPVGGQPATVAVSQQFEQAFVGDGSSPAVARLDLPTRTLGGSSPLAVPPTAIAVSEALGWVFATQAATNSVAILDGIDGTVLDSMTVEGAPAGIAVAEPFWTWVTQQESRTLSGFEPFAPDYFPLGTISLPEAPGQLALHEIPGGSRLAVVALPAANQAALVDLDALQVVAVLPVGANPQSIAVSQESRLALVTNFGGDSVSVIDLLARAIIATVPVGQCPRGAAIHEDLQLGVVTNASDGTLTLIDLSPPPPLPFEVSGFTPTFGPVGTLVTVRGVGYDPASGGTTVTFSSALGRLIAPVLSASATELLVRVPEGATTGPIGVSTARGTAVSGTSFLVTGQPLRIQITSPTDGAVLPTTRVQVTGTLDLSTPTVGVTVNGILAFVNGAQWAAEVPLVAGTNTITATATDALGTAVTAQISVQVPQPQEPAVVLTASPGSGVAPLTVTWQVVNQTGRSLVLFELDPTGTGSFGSPTFEVPPTTYSAPGLFYPTLRVMDDQGTQYTASTFVNVLAQDQLDALLQVKWNSLKAALKGGDIQEALNVIALGSRTRYQQIFQALASDLPFIEDILTDLRFVAYRGKEAVFEMRRVDSGIEKSFDIRFVLENDGIWRLRSF
jgi:YVTN family beta-propeller protein